MTYPTTDYNKIKSGQICDISYTNLEQLNAIYKISTINKCIQK
jgi:hypothetical protein